jgi:hypothetical protein
MSLHHKKFTRFYRANGVRFQTSLIEDSIKELVTINDVVSFRFTWHNSKPVGAMIYRIRYDLAWSSISTEQPKIVHSYGAKLFLNLCASFLAHLFTSDKQKWRKPERRRRFFDKFAKFKMFDPLDAENWYSITRKEIVRAVCLPPPF